MQKTLKITKVADSYLITTETRVFEKGIIVLPFPPAVISDWGQFSRLYSMLNTVPSINFVCDFIALLK